MSKSGVPTRRLDVLSTMSVPSVSLIELATWCRSVRGLLPSHRYTACVAAVDADGNTLSDATARHFESADASPPTVEAAVLWGSVRSDPALHSCSFTLRFSVDQPCKVAYALLDASSTTYSSLSQGVRLCEQHRAIPSKPQSHRTLQSQLLEWHRLDMDSGVGAQSRRGTP